MIDSQNLLENIKLKYLKYHLIAKNVALFTRNSSFQEEGMLFMNV